MLLSRYSLRCGVVKTSSSSSFVSLKADNLFLVSEARVSCERREDRIFRHENESHRRPLLKCSFYFFQDGHDISFSS